MCISLRNGQMWHSMRHFQHGTAQASLRTSSAIWPSWSFQSFSRLSYLSRVYSWLAALALARSASRSALKTLVFSAAASSAACSLIRSSRQLGVEVGPSGHLHPLSSGQGVGASGSFIVTCGGYASHSLCFGGSGCFAGVSVGLQSSWPLGR